MHAKAMEHRSIHLNMQMNGWNLPKWTVKKLSCTKLGVVAHAFNPALGRQRERSRKLVKRQPGLLSETLSQNKPVTRFSTARLNLI